MKQTRKWLVACLAVVIVVSLAVALGVYEREQHLIDVREDALQELYDNAGRYDEQSIVLQNTTKAKAEHIAHSLGAKLRITSDGRFATLTLPDGVTVRDVYEDEQNKELIELMRPDYQASVGELTEVTERRPAQRPSTPTTDEAQSLQTYLDDLNMGSVWSTTKGKGVTVAVIDTGIDTDHAEFSGRISEYSYNATEDKIVKDYTDENGAYDWSLVEDEQGHGTAVTGVIASSMNNGGIVGIAPEVEIIAIKVECDQNGVFTRTSDLVFALYYAIECDADLVNMSFGSPEDVFGAAVQLALDSDVICVASAGNDSTAAPNYPAAYEHVIGVGALAADSWELASYSNYGENVSLVAPGTAYTACMDGGYATKEGSSLSAPIVTGALALYLSRNTYQEFATVTEVLYASCVDLGDLGKDFYYGYGALDISALVTEERGKVTFDMLTDELDDEERLFIRNHTLQSIPEPERLYAVFDGWYYDPLCTEEFVWYEDKFTSDLTLYAGWVNEDDGIPYTYVELADGTVEIRSYTGHRRFIIIPDHIDGKPVSSIGEGAFAGQTSLREVKLPQYLVRIRRAAFANCTGLAHMDIPDSVTEIGADAFSNNVRMSYIAFGNKSALTTVGAEAFAYCSKLKSITLPASVASIDGSALLGTTAMLSIEVAGGDHYRSVDGVLFSANQGTLIAYPAGRTESYAVPSTTVSIGSYAFAYTRLTSIDLTGLNSIGDYAFAYSKLGGVIIPDSVTLMGGGVFQYSTNMRLAVLGSCLTSIPGWTFKGCSSLMTVHIPAGIRTIGAGAFSGATSLGSVSFSEQATLTRIEGEAFEGTALASVALPTTLVSIGESAFAHNASLTEVTVGENCALQFIGNEAFAYNGRLTAFPLPEGLLRIGSYAFRNTGLTGVTLPASLEMLGTGAFASCHALTDIEVDERNAIYVDLDGVVYDKTVTTLVAYAAGNARTSYTVAATTSAVGQSAFYGSWNLRSVALPAGLIEIRETAFYDNASLTGMTMPDSLMQIGRYAFAYTPSMKTVSFGASAVLPRLSFGAFAYSGLTSLRVPASVSTIAQGAFLGCSGLQSVTFAANSTLRSLSAYMFDGCSNLKTITFENGSALTSIQAHGLEGLTKLTTISFGNAPLTNIDNYAFRFCESLARVDIPEGVKTVGRYAFYGCSGLSEISLPESIEYVGRFAFLGTNDADVYFAAETLPATLAQDWDHGIRSYYLGVTDVTTEGDWKYATLKSGNVALLEYMGSATALDLTVLNFGGDIVNLGGELFAYAPLQSIILPDTLVTIQAKAFTHSALVAVDIPASVEFIGREAFSDTPLVSVTFAENASLATIEQSAFAYTESLIGVRLPASLETLGRAVFKHSGIRSLTFADGFAMTELPEEGFAYTEIESLTLPDSVANIDHGAFRGTEQLKSVAFGASELSLQSNAFYQSGLETLIIPENVTYIGEYALVGLSSLTAYEVSASNPNYQAIDGLLVSKNGRKLIATPAGRTGSLTVPAGIEVIGFGAFEDSRLSSVGFLPDANILSFGYRAFYNADGLTTMHIPASVVAIDYYAFAQCSSLASVTFDENSGLRGIYEGAFSGDLKLSEITLPDSIVEISDFAFYGCSALEQLPVSETSELQGIYSYAMAYTGLSELTTPETLIDIGDYAFAGTPLTTVTIPDTKQKELIIGIGAFEKCNELTDITLPFIGASFEDPEITWLGYIFGAGAYKANATYTPESLKTVTITEGITYVGKGAFYELAQLEEIHVPHSVVTLHNYAFGETTARYTLTNTISLDNTYSVSSAEFGKGLYGELVLSEGVTGVSGSAFSNNKNITRVVLPDGLQVIGQQAFLNCHALKSVSIPDSVKTIGNSAFLNCSTLQEVRMSEGVTTIGESAFKSCPSLKSLKFPSTLSKIGKYAFDSCSSMESINFPEGITDITIYGCNALKTIELPKSAISVYLSQCSALTDIDLPIGVTSVTLSGATALTGIELPDSVTSISLSGCSALTDIKIPSGVTNVSISNCGITSVVLPDGVTDIYFKGCKDLKSIKIPDSVSSVDNNAFENCTGLKEVAFSPNTTKIGEKAFSGCSRLVSIQIPEGVTSIGTLAFGYCKSLTSVSLPSSITDIGGQAFYNCSELYEVINLSDLSLTFGATANGYIACYAKSIIDKNGNVTRKQGTGEFEYIETPDGFRFLKENEAYTLISYMGDQDTVTLPFDINGNSYNIGNVTGVKNVIIPDGWTTIPANAFSGNTKLTSIKLPQSLTSIGSNAFSSTALIDIEIPEGVTSLGSNAFSYCSSLKSVTFAPNCELEAIKGWTFYHCTSLTDIVIPESVKTIGLWAFNGCKNLVSIDLPESLTKIDMEAFIGCHSMTDLEIPAGLITIGEDAFSACKNLTLTVHPSNTAYIAVDGVVYDKAMTKMICVSPSLTSVTVPASVKNMAGAFRGHTNIQTVVFEPNSQLTSLDEFAFSGCSSLTGIELPEGLTGIGRYAFRDCTGMKSIKLPSTIKWIGEYALWNCAALTEVEIPDSVTSMGSAVFNDCTSLESVKLPKGLTSIPNAMFSRCSNLTSVEIPLTVTKIVGMAFYSCSKLANVVIPAGVTSIGDNAFDGCSSLTSINIPSTVTSIGNRAFDSCRTLETVCFAENSQLTSIGDSAFYRCSKLTSVNFPNSITSVGSQAFAQCSSLTSIYIPDGVTDVNLSGLSSLTSVEIPHGVTTLNLSDCSSLTGINIPDGVITLNLSGCSNLISIDIPNSVTSLDLSECRNLTHVDLPVGLTTLSNDAFRHCDSLTSIKLPAGVTTLGSELFYGCDSLTSIEIPEGVTKIGYETFRGCDVLVSVELPSTLTSVSEYAFLGCGRLYRIDNNSDLAITIGSSEFGYVAQYAQLIVDKNGVETYRKGTTAVELMHTADGFQFLKLNDAYRLIAYLGEHETVTLPLTFNGNAYQLDHVRGVRHVIVPEGVTGIDVYAFKDCCTLMSIDLPSSVTSIGSNAFYNCTRLTELDLPSKITSVGSYAFYGCIGVTSLTIPEGVTKIAQSMFHGCTGLTNVSLPLSLTNIGESAFSGCSSLTRVELPDGVTSIGALAFLSCKNLTDIEIPNSVTSVGSKVLNGTAYINDPANWEGGLCYCGYALISVDKTVEIVKVREDVTAIDKSAFHEWYLLKKLSIGASGSGLLSQLTNLETLSLTRMPSHAIKKYFVTLPITLKSIVLGEGVKMRAGAFEGITGITIYVEAEEKDVRWDENFPGWSNGNRVVYGDDWITAEFYDAEGNILSSDIYLNSQVIRQPIVELADTEDTPHAFRGWDLNGDGVADSIPATSTDDVIAKALVEKTTRQYAVVFYDKDGTTPIASYVLPYGATVTPPTVPAKLGYTFTGWVGYVEGMTVKGDTAIHSRWTHEGAGHVYGEPVWVAPTCEQRGYNKHTCSVCGEWYGTDHVDALGHSYGKTTVAPTCTEQGFDFHGCPTCGDSYKDNFTDAKGHLFGEWVTDTAATCTIEGARHRVCVNCPQREDEVIPASGHSFTSRVVREASCDKEGQRLYTCGVCGHTETESIAKTAHSYEKEYVSKSWLRMLIEWLLNIFFGYDGEQAYIYKCADCGHIETAEEALMRENASVQETCTHAALGDWTLGMAPSEQGAGVEWRVCASCNTVVEARMYGEASAVKYGDANGDGEINGKDILYIRKYLANYNYDTGESTIAITIAADANGDGEISGKDILIIRKYLANYNYDTGESTIVLGPVA